MDRFRFLLDRTAVLFLGVAAGVAIGFAFGSGGGRRATVALAPEAAPVVGASPATAPPPPAAPAAPEAKVRPPAGIVAEPVASQPPADQPPPQMIGTAQTGGIIHVGVFGDSFGDGVWSALYRLLPASAGYKVTKYSQQSTGFTRYRSLNLEQHDDEQLGTGGLDVAVIAFGANDAQGVCDAGHCGALMSSYWQEVIGRRVESYVAMLRRHGAQVYWVGMPVMRDPGYDSDTSAMNAFYMATMRRLSVPFIDIRPLTIDGDGHYQAYYADADGSQKLLRAGDGIHMSMNGYLRVTKGLASRIRSTVEAAHAAAPAASGADQANPS